MPRTAEGSSEHLKTRRVVRKPRPERLPPDSPELLRLRLAEAKAGKRFAQNWLRRQWPRLRPAVIATLARLNGGPVIDEEGRPVDREVDRAGTR
jgi:hypothetical protein